MSFNPHNFYLKRLGNYEMKSRQRNIAFTKRETTFGRHKDCDVVLKNYIGSNTSAKHCTIIFEGRRMFIRDDNSSKGTFVDYNKINNEKIELFPNNLIGFGYNPHNPSNLDNPKANIYKVIKSEMIILRDSDDEDNESGIIMLSDSETEIDDEIHENERVEVQINRDLVNFGASTSKEDENQLNVSNKSGNSTVASNNVENINSNTVQTQNSSAAVSNDSSTVQKSTESLQTQISTSKHPENPQTSTENPQSNQISSSNLPSTSKSIQIKPALKLIIPKNINPPARRLSTNINPQIAKLRSQRRLTIDCQPKSTIDVQNILKTTPMNAKFKQTLNNFMNLPKNTANIENDSNSSDSMSNKKISIEDRRNYVNSCEPSTSTGGYTTVQKKPQNSDEIIQKLLPDIVESLESRNEPSSVKKITNQMNKLKKNSQFYRHCGRDTTKFIDAHPEQPNAKKGRKRKAENEISPKVTKKRRKTTTEYDSVDDEVESEVTNVPPSSTPSFQSIPFPNSSPSTSPTSSSSNTNNNNKLIGIAAKRRKSVFVQQEEIVNNSDTLNEKTKKMRHWNRPTALLIDLPEKAPVRGIRGRPRKNSL